MQTLTALFLLGLATLFSQVVVSAAQPATLQFQDCSKSSANLDIRLNVSTIYAQILHTPQMGDYLNLTVFGTSPQDIIGASPLSSNLSTLFTSTSILTLSAFMNSSYFCDTLRPPSPLPSGPNTSSTYCPIPAGPFGLSASVPWGKNRELTTLVTRLRAVDPFTNELLCVEVSTTPLEPDHLGSPYGKAYIIFWSTLTLAIVYWLTVGIARIVSARNRGISRPAAGWWSSVQNAGFRLASATSGEMLASYPALIRFGTPSMRDIVFHTQWCAMLSMVAVQWPTFVYPLLAQTAWSTLVYNVTVVAPHDAPFHHWDPLSVKPFKPPAGFIDQITDPSSPLYINTSVPSTLFTLPDDASPGITSFAYTVGVHPQDLFRICLTIFLGIIAGTILLSLIVWAVDWLATSLFDAFAAESQQNQISRLSGARSPRFLSSGKDLDSTAAINVNADENQSVNLFRVTSRFGQSASSRRAWWRRTNISSSHGSVLLGNLVRILVLFHFPVTIFSCYQMTLPRSKASPTSIALAAMSFILFSVILPVVLVRRLKITATSKLYDEIRTLLSYGPLYNHYRHGSQLFASLFFATNFAVGITVGCGQKSGTAQAIIILIVEVVSALVTSIWLPWGKGAGMGLISFSFCVARIVAAVLLVILTPTIAIGESAGGWVAYGILMILALVYIAFALMLVVKFIEAGMRIVSGIGFDHSNHPIDSGLFGICGLMGCCGPRQRQRSHRRRLRATEAAPSQVSAFARPNGSGVMKAHSSPPSVLRPEQALRPYREDSDDEHGYIMGAWQPSLGPGYHVIDDPPSPVPLQSSPARTGFTRVGGGRAHFESPYAIASSSKQVPLPQGRGGNAFDPSQLIPSTDEEMVQASRMLTSEQNVQATPVPFHVRTKSQTAIVEDTGTLISNTLSQRAPETLGQQRQDGTPSPPPSPTSRRPGTTESGGNKRKPWNAVFRRARPQSEGSLPHPLPQLDPLLSSTPPGSEPRSFIVIRNRKPQGSSSSADNAAAAAAATSTANPVVTPDLENGNRHPRGGNATA